MGGEVTGEPEVTHPSHPPPAPRELGAYSALLVFGATLAVFWPSLSHGFVAWDDDVNFLMNPYFRGLTGENVHWMFTTFHVGHYMPLTWLSAALDYELWGMEPKGYHLTNVLLHALAAVLFARVILRLLPAEVTGSMRQAAAAGGALFFALHPLRVESVAWITERRDVLSGVFLMASVLAWLRSREADGHRGWYALALAAFAGSLLSKVSGMALPAVLLLLDVFERRRPQLARLAPFFALSVAGALLGYFGQRESTELLATIQGLPLGHRLAVAAYGLWFYVEKTLVPIGLSPLYEIERDFDPLRARYLASAAAAITITGVLWTQRKRRVGAALLFAWLAYAVLAAPTLGLLQAGRQVAADRYSYLACLPFAALFAGAVSLCDGRWKWGLRALILVCVVLAGLTRVQLAHWADSESLFRRMVAVQPDSFLAHRKLGIALHERGRFGEAMAEFERCLELRPERDHADAWTSLALSAMARGEPGDLDRTFVALDAALADAPRDPLAWDVLENLLLRAGRAAELETRAAAALAADAENDRALLALARLQAARGDPAAALSLCERLLGLDPDHFEALKLAGAQYAYLARWGEARTALEHARRLRPRDPGVLSNLGLVVSRQGDTPGAEALWREALRLDPSHAAARRFLDSPESR
jgi:tetratricopeptide (TPR) repeat protein